MMTPSPCFIGATNGQSAPRLLLREVNLLNMVRWRECKGEVESCLKFQALNDREKEMSTRFIDDVERIFPALAGGR
jgi:hypothetical protein